MYRISKYTFVRQIGMEYILANTYTGAVGKIDANLYHKIGNGSSALKNLDQETWEILKSNGFIVPNSLDEYQRIIQGEKKAIFSQTDTLFLTISTSARCNYACSYCFEPMGDQTNLPIMNHETAYNVITYVKEKITSSIKKLVITWFGGEPLLGLDAIEKISKVIIPFCDDNLVEYHAEIITNGYLLTAQSARKLSEDYRISSAQITIDGPEEIYEKIKQTPKGAYQRVLQNIKDSSKFMKINIRLNIPEYFYPQMPNFIDTLMLAIGNCNIKIYLAEVCDDWTDYCGKKEAKTTTYWIQNSQFIKYMKKKYPHALFTSKLPLAYCGMKCGMIKKHNITIGAKGELYRCVHMVGRDKEVIGTCTEGFYYNEADCKFDEFEHPSICKDCIVFPICMTGCPNDILEGKMRAPCEMKRESIIQDLIKQAL